MSKKTFGKKNKVKCEICGKGFRATQQLNNHVKIHGNNNNKKNKNYKNIFKKFLNFIIKIIICFNFDCDLNNYIGDEGMQRHAIKKYLFKNKIYSKLKGETTYINDLDSVADQKPKEEEEIDEEEDNETRKFLYYWRGEPVYKYKKTKINDENKEGLAGLEDWIENLKKEEENKEKEKIKNKTKLDRKILKDIILEIDSRIDRDIRTKYDNDNITSFKPFVDYEIKSNQAKISMRQLIKLSELPDEKKEYAFKYINKKFKDDYPDNEEIENKMGKIMANEVIKQQKNNKKTEEKYQELLQYIKNYEQGKIGYLRCDACGKFIREENKKRHMLHNCKKIIKYYNNNKNNFLKRFLENNYKKLNYEQIDAIVEEFKEKNIYYILNNLRRFIKYSNSKIKILVKTKKIKEKNKEKLKEKNLIAGPIFMKRGFRDAFIRQLIQEVRDSCDK